MPIVITDSAPRGRRRGTDTAAGNLSSSKRSRLYRATPTAGGDRAARYETATPRVGKKRESQHRHRPRTLRLQTPTAWMHPNKSEASVPAGPGAFAQAAVGRDEDLHAV